MTEDSDDLLDSIAAAVDDETRRSFMKKGAAVSGAAALGVGATNTAAAQDVNQEGGKALIFPGNFYPRARFAIVSPIVEWVPNYPDIRDSAWSNYNTRMIRWQNTGEVVSLWVAHDAEVGNYDQNSGFVTDADADQTRPQLFEMNQEWEPFGDNQNLTTVEFSPLGGDELDDLLDDDGWWQDDGGGGGTSTPTGTGDGS